jgi:hypothetical protein
MRAPRSRELAPGKNRHAPIVARLYFKERAQGARRKAGRRKDQDKRKAQGSRTKAQGANKTKHRRNNLIVVDGKQLIYIKPMQLCILTKDKTK